MLEKVIFFQNVQFNQIIPMVEITQNETAAILLLHEPGSTVLSFGQDDVENCQTFSFLLSGASVSSAAVQFNKPAPPSEFPGWRLFLSEQYNFRR